MEAKLGVANVVKNRVRKPGWWGVDYCTVILKPWQFSSFDGGDPNDSKFPQADDPSWTDSKTAASRVFLGQVPDNTGGATYYHDVSIAKPAKWVNMVLTVRIGRLLFYKETV